MSDKKIEQNIDYLHPDGKPVEAQKIKKEDEYSIAEKSVDKAIAEADGHHMCSAECQEHHDV